MPRAAPGATIGAEVFGGVGGDLVCGGGLGFAFGGVLALAVYRAFGFVVVHEVFGFPFWSVPLLLAAD
jgi:hypothetical protein